ncbi:MAG: GAF domain-containing protein [Candidatus Rokubacteria bacterium]|nr:GAF domain-containing protein [Candidatus Rokubacteria bacterium]
MTPRLFYFSGSETARLVLELPGTYDRVPLRPADVDDPETVGPGVLVVEGSERNLELASRFRITRHNVEVVVLADPANLPAFPSDQVYAYLPTPVSVPILTKTLANALAHIRLLHEQEQAQADLSELAQELKELNLIGVKLSAERDTDLLLELILTKAREITRSDAGSLYLVEEDEDGHPRLRFKLAQNDSLNVPFKEFTLPISHQSVAGHVALTGEIQNLEDAYTPPPGSPFQINLAFDRQVGYRTKSMLVIPLKTQKNEVIGVLQLINCKPDPVRVLKSPAEIEKTVIPFSARYQELAASLASQAAVALENSRLYKNIQTLFEGFVKASVTAIEARDPTTAGHSFRVADLTTGLAEVVDRVETGPFRVVRFTPEEMQEIRYAAILHDFGKIGVREEVLVKAKKLLPNHLELIKQRANLVKQGLELRYGRRKIAYLLEHGQERFAEQFAADDAELAALVQEIDDYLKAVVMANEPSVMPEDFATAIQQIALKSFADHLGNPRAIITPQEARILSIPKGSLTEEERVQIESHVVHTFQFLSQIPWTRELKRVPDIARAHHEKLNGTGYPYGMRVDEIPVQSKIMTISDIFDALTAADRPYKKAVPVEQALDILDYEKKAGAIDSALLTLFIEAKVYQRVATGS